jgi:ABC-type proline/glycine betaine transport system substrate-binding protein
MNKRFFWLLTLLLLAAGTFAEAQPGKVYRIGYLSGGLASSTFNIDTVRRELRELGYVEGKTSLSSLAMPKTSRSALLLSLMS